MLWNVWGDYNSLPYSYFALFYRKFQCLLFGVWRVIFNVRFSWLRGLRLAGTVIWGWYRCEERSVILMDKLVGTFKFMA